MTLRIDDSHIHYTEKGEGLPVVLLHGSRVDHHLMTGCFEPVFEQLPGYRRIYPDLPGMGLSKPGKGVNDDTSITQVLLEFIDRLLGGQPFLLVGESFGGQLARGIIEQISGRIRGALFLCPYIADIAQTLPERTVAVSDPAYMQSLGETARASFELLSVIQTQEVHTAFRQDIGSYLHLADHAFIDALGQTLEFDLSRRYHFPTSFIMGRQDHATGYEGAYAVLPCYPRASFSVLDCAGHNLQIEQPEVFQALVKEWLARVQLSAV